MTDRPSHESKVGLSLIALAIEKGFLQGGQFQVLVTSTELLPDGIHIDKDTAVHCAVGLLEAGGGVTDKPAVCDLFRMLYDELAGTVGYLL